VEQENSQRGKPVVLTDERLAVKWEYPKGFRPEEVGDARRGEPKRQHPGSTTAPNTSERNSNARGSMVERAVRPS